MRRRTAARATLPSNSNPGKADTRADRLRDLSRHAVGREGTVGMLGTDIEVVCRCGARAAVGFQRLGERVACARCGATNEATLRLDDLALEPVRKPARPEPAAVSASRRSRRRSSGARLRAKANARVNDQLVALLWVAGALLAVIVIATR